MAKINVSEVYILIMQKRKLIIKEVHNLPKE